MASIIPTTTYTVTYKELLSGADLHLPFVKPDPVPATVFVDDPFVDASGKKHSFVKLWSVNQGPLQPMPPEEAPNGYNLILAAANGVSTLDPNPKQIGDIEAYYLLEDGEGGPTVYVLAVEESEFNRLPPIPPDTKSPQPVWQTSLDMNSNVAVEFQGLQGSGGFWRVDLPSDGPPVQIILKEKLDSSGLSLAPLVFKRWHLAYLVSPNGDLGSYYSKSPNSGSKDDRTVSVEPDTFAVLWAFYGPQEQDPGQDHGHGTEHPKVHVDTTLHMDPWVVSRMGPGGVPIELINIFTGEKKPVPPPPDYREPITNLVTIVSAATQAQGRQRSSLAVAAIVAGAGVVGGFFLGARFGAAWGVIGSIAGGFIGAGLGYFLTDRLSSRST